MMYSNRFVCSLKVGGKILRENQGVVSLPFGSEYNILLKNLNSRRCMVKVSVDGQDATEGTRLIIGPNDSLELERFIKSGNLDEGNRFKFIERTKNIEDHRGIKADDGLIRVEFWAEKEVIDAPIVRRHYYDEWVPYYRLYPWYYPSCPAPQPSITWTSSGAMGSSPNQGSLTGGAQAGIVRSMGSVLNKSADGQMMAMNCSVQPQANLDVQEQANDAGITVPGSLSDQKFHSSCGFPTESNSHVIVLQLKGKTVKGKISKAVTVDTKTKCPTCGKKQKSLAKFCGECGTSLNIV